MIRSIDSIRVKVVSVKEQEITVEAFSSDHLNKIRNPPFIIGSVVLTGSGKVKLDCANPRPLMVYTAQNGQNPKRLIESHTYDLTYQKS